MYSMINYTVTVRSIDNFNYLESANFIKENVSDKTKLQDALIVLNKINGSMDLIFLIKDRLKEFF